MELWVIESFSSQEEHSILVENSSGYFFKFKTRPDLITPFKINVELFDGKIPVGVKVVAEIVAPEGCESLKKEITVTFKEGETSFDLVFSQTQQELMEKQYFENDSIIISLETFIVETNFDESDVILVDEGSRHLEKCNDYCGLENQGSTCYMNSTLQILFNIPMFRKKIFEAKIEEPQFDPNIQNPKKDLDKKKKRNVFIEALQVLFARLQTKKGTIDTYYFTRTLEMGDSVINEQKDISEFIDFVISELGDVCDMFTGKLTSYIKCKSVDYETKKENIFTSLPVDIKGFSSLEESLDGFFKKEQLDGDNKYKTEEFGYQEAEIGSTFSKIPPVLFIQLKRFEFNFDTNENEKANHFFSYPKSISLNKYTDNQDEDNEYELVGVVVHTGSSNYGHYYTFFRPNAGNEWIKFNDTSVTYEDPCYVFEDNFGGMRDDGERMKIYSAYILVYARKKDFATIFEKVGDDLITEDIKSNIGRPPKRTINLFDTFKGSKFVKLRRSDKTKKVFTKESLSRDSRYSIMWLENEYQNIPSFNPNMEYKDLYSTIGEYIGFSTDFALIWAVDSYFPSKLIELEESGTCEAFENCQGFFVYDEFDYNDTDFDELSITKGADFIVVFIYIYNSYLYDPLRFYRSLVKSASTDVQDFLDSLEESLGFKFECEVLDENRQLVDIGDKKYLGDFALDMSAVLVLSTEDSKASSLFEDRERPMLFKIKDAKHIMQSKVYGFPSKASEFIYERNNVIPLNVKLDFSSQRILLPPDTSGETFFDYIYELFKVKCQEDDVMVIYKDNDKYPEILNLEKKISEYEFINGEEITIMIESVELAKERANKQRVFYSVISKGAQLETNSDYIAKNVTVGNFCKKIEEELETSLYPIEAIHKKVKRIIPDDVLVSDLETKIYFLEKIESNVEGRTVFFSFTRINKIGDYKNIDFPFMMSVGDEETVGELSARLKKDVINIDVSILIKDKFTGIKEISKDCIVVKELEKEGTNNVYLLRK